MQILCATDGIVSYKYPRSGVRDIVKGGYSNVFLNISQSMIERTTKKIFDTCQGERLSIIAGYAETTSKTLDEQSIKIAGDLGCKYLVMHLNEIFALEYYLKLAEIAKESNIMILFENQVRNFNGHYIRDFCSDEIEAVNLIDSLNEEVGEERFGFSMNIGILGLCGQNMQDFALALGQRLKIVVLQDSDSNNESAMLPFTNVYEGHSRINWLDLIRGLRGINFDGLLVMQITDTAAAFSPIIRPELLKLSMSIAEYFKWQISLESLIKKYSTRVLFGAGNMCRAYMKCYGENYPPLFTCDNNKKIWDSEFCGLKVMSPEKLKEIPKDCAIFICNIYYSEIENQLREMGLENPIERFNDEYLPNYHFDRI